VDESISEKELSFYAIDSIDSLESLVRNQRVKNCG